MNKIFAAAILIIIGTEARTQSIDSITQDNIKIINTNTKVSGQPYYVIIAGQKQFTFDTKNYKEKDSPLALIEPDWIEQITILKDEKAIEKYGKSGRSGVVIIKIKKEKVELLPDDLLKTPER